MNGISSPDSAKSFCCDNDSTTDYCMPIGQWFERVHVSPFDWQSASEEQFKQCDGAEDYIMACLCRLHKLPEQKTGDCSFTADELAASVDPQSQYDIWIDLTSKFYS